MGILFTYTETYTYLEFNLVYILYYKKGRKQEYTSLGSCFFSSSVYITVGVSNVHLKSFYLYQIQKC